MKPPDRASAARWVATKVLARVATDDAWATPTLDAEISRANLDRRDAALATELTYGALRTLPALDAALDALLKEPGKVDPYLRAALRVGAYQLLHLRVPPHAAVSDTVTIVRTERGPRLAGVANAVLRKIAKARPEDPQPPDRMLVPGWIERELQGALGEARSASFLGPRRMPPPMGLRAVVGSAAELAEQIRAARPEAEVEVSRVASRGVSVRGAGDPRTLPGYAEGRFAVQELGSQRVVDLVAPEPGERIADLCCGHGTKTLALLERVGDGSVEAVDLYEEKLERLEQEAARLAFDATRLGVWAVDLTKGTGGLEAASFDRVLLDAPCTGLGTYHRRPELAPRLARADVRRMAALSQQLLATAVRLVRPGGVLVYAVCSLTSAEGPAAASAFEAAHPGLTRLAEEGEEDADRVQRIGPWLGEDLDGYQVVRWTVGERS